MPGIEAIAYADDVLIRKGFVRDSSELAEKVAQIFSEVGLKVNTQKCTSTRTSMHH